jgi:hypothetical protein
VCHFETALYRHWDKGCREHIRLAVLKGLKDASDVMLVSLGQFGNVVLGEQTLEVGWLGRIAPQEFKHGAGLEDARDLIAGENHRDSPLRGLNPLGQLALSMRVGSVHFV